MVLYGKSKKYNWFDITNSLLMVLFALTTIYPFLYLITHFNVF